MQFVAVRWSTAEAIRDTVESRGNIPSFLNTQYWRDCGQPYSWSNTRNNYEQQDWSLKASKHGHEKI